MRSSPSTPLHHPERLMEPIEHPGATDRAKAQLVMDERRGAGPRLPAQFKLVSDYTPQGDQPRAIEQLTEGVVRGHKHQVLLGVTGSGKTFTMANVIANTHRPTLVLAHNKTLAAQLYQELKS